MPDPERSISNDAEVETNLLRAELANLFRENAGKVAVRMLDDLELPTNIVLAGTYQATSEAKTRDKIKVCHRIFNNENDYLVMMHEGAEVHWAHITDSLAQWVWSGRPPLTKEAVQKIDQRLQPDSVKWDINAAQKSATTDDPFEDIGFWV